MKTTKLILAILAMFIVAMPGVLAVAFDSDGNGIIEAPDLIAINTMLGRLQGTEINVSDCISENFYTAEFCQSLDIGNDGIIAKEEANKALTIVKFTLSGPVSIPFDANGNGMTDSPDLTAVETVLASADFSDYTVEKCDKDYEWVYAIGFCKTLDLNNDAKIVKNEIKIALDEIQMLLTGEYAGPAKMDVQFDANGRGIFEDDLAIAEQLHAKALEGYSTIDCKIDNYDNFTGDYCEFTDSNKDGIISAEEADYAVQQVNAALEWYEKFVSLIPYDADGNGIMEAPDLSGLNSVFGYAQNIDKYPVADCDLNFRGVFAKGFCKSLDISNDSVIVPNEFRMAMDMVKTGLSNEYSGPEEIKIPFDSDFNGIIEVPDLIAANNLLGTVLNKGEYNTVDCSIDRYPFTPKGYCESFDFDTDGIISKAEAESAMNQIKATLNPETEGNNSTGNETNETTETEEPAPSSHSRHGGHSSGHSSAVMVMPNYVPEANETVKANITEVVIAEPQANATSVQAAQPVEDKQEASPAIAITPAVEKQASIAPFLIAIALIVLAILSVGTARVYAKRKASA